MSTIIVKISGVVVQIREATLQIRKRVDDKDTCTFTVVDSAGTAAYTKGQPVSVVDSSLGTLFTGFINKPTATNLYPNATNLWSMDCVNHFYVAAKKATKTTTGKTKRGGKHKNQHAGAIVANQIKEYLAPDGVTGNFGLDWSELQTDWQMGTQSGVTATTNTSTGNVGAGDLELAVAGTGVSFQQSSYADFNAAPVAGGMSAQSSGGVAFTSTPAIKFQATEAVPGISTAYAYVKIWDHSLGAYTIPSTFPTLFYDVWIADSCPQQMTGIEIVCTDGTSFIANAANYDVDPQGVNGILTNDLAGLATNQWYSRTLPLYGVGSLGGKTLQYVAVAFGGSNQGTYTAYYRNVKIAQNDGTTNKLDVFSSTATSIAITPQSLQNNGYTSMTCAFVTSYERHGYMYSPAFSVSAAGLVQGSYLTWGITLPNSNFTFTITATIDGSTFLPCTMNAAIPGILTGMNLSGKSVQFVYVFDQTGENPTLTPLLSFVQGNVSPSYTCTKSDVISTTNAQAGWNAGTLTNLTAPGGAILQLNGSARNYDDGVSSSQTIYGASSPSAAVVRKQFTLSSATGADARAQLNFAGQWQNFTAEMDVSLPAASTQLGFVYRTTGWQNNNDSYGYTATISTTSIQLGHGTNSSSGAGVFTPISPSPVSVTLSTGQVYHLKIVVSGNSHQIYLNDVLYLSATDATYTATGYLGFRIYNGSGSTQTGTFDNFGVMAALSGTWVSPAIDIHALSTISNSEIILQTDPAVNYSLVSFLVEISLNNGSTWTTCPNNVATSTGYYQVLPVPGLSAGTNVSSMNQVLIRLTISTATASVGAFGGSGQLLADLTAVTFTVLGAYSSSGTRSTAPLVWDSVNRLNVASGFGNASDTQTYVQTGTGTTSVSGLEASIVNTTGDVHMVPGSATWTDEDGSVRFQLSAATIQAGIELRYVDSSHYYRLAASTTALAIIKNVGSGATTLATSVVTISTGAWYRMRFRVTGSAPVTLQGRMWADGTEEPTTWNTVASD